MYPELRRDHAAALIDIGFDGYAIGGLSVGEEKELMHEMTEATVPALPADYPVYLMGVGTPADLVEGVWRGVDMFDCVMPTRNARNGSLFTSSGKITIKNSRYRDDPLARLTKNVAVTPAGTTPAPTSATSSMPGRSSATISTPFITCITT